jgi:2-keto-4-pentenoate hydratase/2-oxohepta-3-ene-1,7-dioic acid hydratase in catechol pathway
MRLCRFLLDDGARVGALGADGQVYDLGSLTGAAPDDMASFIAGGQAVLDAAAGVLASGVPAVALADAAVLAPILPPRMRNFSVYEGHIKQAVKASATLRAGRVAAAAMAAAKLNRPPGSWYRAPQYYKGNHLSVAGPYDDIRRPVKTQQLDYEIELAVVVGTSGRDLAVSEAMSHVYGYLLLDDVSARDLLVPEIFGRLGPAKGKDFDTGNVLGPWLVTADEIPDPTAMTGTVTVNGTLMATCVTSDMHFTIAEMVARASEGETIVPGEVFGTGCCTNGAGLEQMFFLSDGDLVELEMGVLGAQRNRVVAP